MPPRAESIQPSAPPKGDKPASPPQSPAVKMPMGRVDSPASPPVNIGNLAPKLDDFPEPLPWASLNAKHALKKQPILDDASFWRTATRGGSVSGNSFRPRESAPPKAEDKQDPPKTEHAHVETSKPVLARFTLARLTEDCKREVTGAWSEASHAVSELCANARHSYAAWGVRNKVGRARQDAAARIGKLRTDIARQSKAAAARRGQTLSSAMTASITAAKGAALRVQRKVASSFEGSSQLTSRLAAPRVRVRIATRKQVTAFSQRLTRVYADSRLAIQRNSRLVTSMTMAGLSAVLTLSLISIVSRNQPSASAGTRTTTAPRPQRNSAAQPISANQAASHSQKAEPTSSKASDVAPVAVRQISSPKPSAVVSTALRAPVESSRSKPLPVRRPHRNTDEDYVARDTYVYYGAKGKQSR
jgi:hypothetical protein